ncbi:amidophosphoribosyltransferase [Alphaproteobacteria bacterium]|jgi:amidophosphoribosyltransferase|nr:amidophosphoribosyltransferase [Alphaproteobacteria bacterium]MBT5798454.1 amidophosphoribosyltransferase [Alphaproteobacteria bacterium]MDA9815993.1 amidophosphoribosyltransferase [Alphaproteobacteria bacterium]MDC0394782.1 amidophosphoribosyltransferase [Alphaproteobacteria bacterium]MDC0461457.1 amidophosphoribosyltransferase [Alphaproteobacteria bacterium]
MSETKHHLFEEDKLSEECAVFGVFGSSEAHLLTALGLHALQHRGQEATGMVTFDGNQFNEKRGLGHVSENFNASSMKMDELAGYSAIGHNRYSTTGQSEFRNIQPFLTELAFGEFAIAHNGNLTNAERVRRTLVDTGSLFQSTTDTETIIHLVARSRRSKPEERIKEALLQIEGAYALVALTKDMLIGVRDPLGVRPLILGQLNQSYILTSETCALDIIGASYVRDIDPGEMVLIDKNGVRSIRISEKTNSRFCIFEYIYFSRPDSVIERKSVYGARKMIGAELARESHIIADLVIPVPDSGVPAALGYAEESGIPFELGIIRNHYVGRTFIQPSQDARSSSVMMKHNANTEIIAGKDIILVDDSIVRGTTSRKIVKMMREAGAKSVHMRIASPPTINPCFYGVDTPDKENLIAAKLNLDNIRNEIEADSLAFISIDGLYRAMGENKRNKDAPQYCDACFTGDYPIAPSRDFISRSKKDGI